MVLLLVGYVAATVRGSSQREAVVREARDTRLALTGRGALSAQHGQPGAPVQSAEVALTLRNTGAVPLRLVEATLDGTARSVDVRLRPGMQVDVPVTWRVRCAEVGSLRGPRVLHIIAQGPVRRHDVRLDVPEPSDQGALAQLFHRAAVQVCDVLVEQRN